MTTEELGGLRTELSIKAKNGIDFTLAASVIWLVFAFLWTLNVNTYYKSIYVFMASAPLFPLALLFSKILKTNWKIPNNPLQPLGLWLNFAQFFYFPIMFFAMIKMPEYFILFFAIITGAHLFPYGWFYKTKWYSVISGIIVVGSLLLGLNLSFERMYLVALFTSASLFILTSFLYFDSIKKLKTN